ncbi:HupE/UreJ family protein [Methyloceanibacter sp.]|uniref:HupE/UreJ family protein n=1 Tax=Methyloceanibacter sp. TaxID=1965321 RepID=UPI002BDD58C4|nr:HupE/UreJ family protein [Methyloceanibacter sp.]HML93043.1 HupE/UreJ family protein [Methyloceanibacter sp.]
MERLIYLVTLALWLGMIMLAPATALAHTEGGVPGGFASGFAHPILGWDHVIAMVAVGLWGAFLGVPSLWLLPIVFPLVMAFGAGLGLLGVPLPAIETGIAASGIVLGLLILLAARFPLWLAIAVVGAFAIFHGYAHGTELPDAANPFAYVVGFVIATGLLHLIGIGFGFLTHWPAGVYAVRAVGALIAVFGVGFLIGFA